MKNQRSLRGKTWRVQTESRDISVLQTAVLRARQGAVPAQIWREPKLLDLGDAYQLRGLAVAVDRIQQAIARQERIMVYGDFDCDGITSTVSLVHALQRLGAAVSYRIPDRTQHSHGLKPDLLDEIIQTGTKLLITVDCGVNDRAMVAYAVKNGLEVIITDHHQVDPERVVDQALAIVNPNHPDCPYPAKNLAGVGVVFKLLQALAPDDDWLQPYLALTAVGTVADCVPLTGESRQLVQLGLQALNKGYWPGITHILNDVPEMASDTIAFQLAPCLNAASRLGQVQHAVQLFLGAPSRMADRVAYLQQLNQERRGLTVEFTEQAIAQVQPEQPVQVFFLEECPVGVLGLVASRMVEALGQPAFCVARHPNGGLHGSARGPKGADLASALEACAPMLGEFGGHDGAAGFRLDEAHLVDFMYALQAWYAQRPLRELYLEIEGTVPASALSLEWLRWQNSLAPFGVGNPTPLWQVAGVTLTDLKAMGEGRNHARMQFENQHEAVAFEATDLLEQLKINQSYDVVVQLSANTWKGQTKVQWQVVDVRMND